MTRRARSTLIPTTVEIQAFFEHVATDWDTMRLAYYDESVIERMSARSGISGETGHPMRVVDVGTGTGFVAAGLVPRVERVIGVDNSPAMLRTARGKLDALGAENVELVRGDLSALPPNSGSVDAAFANMVLHHAEDPAAMMSEMARVVRPGGLGRDHGRGSASLRVDAPRARRRVAGVLRGRGRRLLREGRARRVRLRIARDAVMHPLYDLGRGRRHRHIRRLGPEVTWRVRSR